MKKLFCLLLFVCIIFSSFNIIYADTNRDIKVRLVNFRGEDFSWVSENWIEFDVKPQIVDGRTMVPIRAVTEALGFNVDWDDLSQCVTIYKEINQPNDNSVKNKWYNFEQFHRPYCVFTTIDSGKNMRGFSNEIIFTSNLNNIKVSDFLYKETSGKKYIKAYFHINEDESFLELQDTDLGSATLTYSMDVPPMIIDDRTLVPLRAMAETFGYYVEWNDKDSVVTIAPSEISKKPAKIY